MNISDVEKRTGLSSTAIRYYENCGLVQVQRKANGYRTYDEETVALLGQIRQLRELGIGLADIRLWRDGASSQALWARAATAADFVRWKLFKILTVRFGLKNYR